MKINFQPKINNFLGIRSNYKKANNNNFYNLKPLAMDSVSFSQKKETEKNEKLVVILVGPPNGGKGTSSSFINQKYNIPQIGMGNILRNEAKKGSMLGELAKPYLLAGTMIPDEITYNIFINRIKEDDCKNGYILDGFPRTKELAGMLQNYFDKQKDIKLKVIELDVKEDVLYERCEKRYICNDCGNVYSIDKETYKNEKPSCECGGELIKREDDNSEKLQQRIDYYKTSTKPVLEFYKEKGFLNKIKIDTTDYSIEEMTENIEKIIESEE